MSSMGKKLFSRGKTGKKKHGPDSRDDLDMDHHLYAAYSRSSAASLVPPMKSAKSNSLGSVTSEPSTTPLEQEDFMSLMHDVRNFSDALGKLKEVFTVEDEGGLEGDIRVSAHEKLGEVLSVLRSVLQKCPALHTTDVLTDAVVLISKIKGCHYEDLSNDIPELHACVDQLALDFSISVSEYLMGDVDTYPQLGKTKSFDNLATADSDLGTSDDVDSRDTVSLTAEELDSLLVRREMGMDIALTWAKAWAKYTKEILAYVERRAQLECEFAKGLSKLAASTRQLITEEKCLPFQSVYCSALEQDMEFSNNSQSMCALIQTQKFLEPLTLQRQEHEKIRKSLKEQWSREMRKMQEAVVNLKKARSQYITRQQEYEKAKEVAQKAETESLAQAAGANQGRADKKKKHEEEANHRAIESETTYKGCVADANCRQRDLERIKAEILSKIREIIRQSDLIMKTVTVTYFESQQAVIAPLPVQYETLCNSSEQYEPGTQYDEFVRRLTVSTTHNNNNQEPFTFEPYAPDGKYSERKQSTQSSGSGSSDVQFSDDSPGGEKLQRGLNQLKAWPLGVNSNASDTDSISESSCKSQESSPSASPYVNRPQHLTPDAASYNDEPEAKDLYVPSLPPGVSVSAGHNDTRFHGVTLSRAAQTHVFKKLRTPSRCRKCESYVYFHGAECAKCGLTSHKKCLESLHWECGRDCSQRPLQRRMTTFGVDLKQHVQETHTDIPVIVQKCTEEIDERGLHTKGIYRLSGVKSRVEKLCQSFEIDEGNVDLSEHHPNVIANVLKLYLRQLPEPLLTYKLYPDLLNLVKEDAQMESSNEIKLVQRLNSMVTSLPTSNFRTLALLMHHLRRVTECEDTNQMSASNLGIVFGPTLLRPSEGATSLNSLMDTPHQTKIVELLITHVEYVFGPDEKPPEPRPLLLPPPKPKEKETPVEVLTDEGSGAKTEQTETSPDGLKPEEKCESSAQWVIGDVSLLDEITAQIDKDLKQSSEEFTLPGSTGAVGKTERVEQSERLEKTEEKEMSASPKSELAPPPTEYVEDRPESDMVSDDDLPLPDDSPNKPFSSSCPFTVHVLNGTPPLTSLTGTPALGPSFTNRLTNPSQNLLSSSSITSHSKPVASTPTSSLTGTPQYSSSPGLRRKLLMTEVLNRAHSSSSISTGGGSDDDKSKPSVPLSMPRPYSPPVRRKAVRGSPPDSSSPDLPVRRSPVTGGDSEPGQPPPPQSLSTFYAPNVIQPIKPQSAVGALALGVVDSVSPPPMTRSDSPRLKQSESDREPEYV